MQQVLMIKINACIFKIKGNNLSLIINKSNYILFHSLKRSLDNVHINLNNTTIASVQQTKFFGVTINERMN